MVYVKSNRADIVGKYGSDVVVVADNDDDNRTTCNNQNGIESRRGNFMTNRVGIRNEQNVTGAALLAMELVMVLEIVIIANSHPSTVITDKQHVTIPFVTHNLALSDLYQAVPAGTIRGVSKTWDFDW